MLGVGLAGFFDGILLHQVLQWHHLLSLVPGETFRDLRTQVLADGLFHVLMYLITALGLWLLWRVRGQTAEAGWRATVGGLLLGFGLWNVLDVAFFHWILGIHRIRVDVTSPMAYDLAWLALFGIVPLLLAWWSLRAGPPDSPGEQSGGRAASAAAAVLALVAAPLAALPQPNTDSALVLLMPGSSAASAFATAARAGTPLMWVDPAGGMMVVRLGPGDNRRLYSSGAVYVTRSPALAGCIASLRA